MAVSGIDELPDLELFETYPEYPVPGRAAERPETVPAGHRPAEILRRHLRARYVFINIDGFVAVIPFRLGCNERNRRINKLGSSYPFPFVNIPSAQTDTFGAAHNKKEDTSAFWISPSACMNRDSCRNIKSHKRSRIHKEYVSKNIKISV